MALRAGRRDPHAKVGASGGTAIHLIAVLAVAWMATVSGPSVKVPRGPAPVIDGRIDSAEWAGAAVEQGANGLTVRLRHDGTSLFLAITNRSGEGFPSICALNGDTMRVLHASAALGAMVYTRKGERWTSPDTAFVYAMRNTALTPAAGEERRAYLAQHGWVASTFRMGNGRNHEIQMSLGMMDEEHRMAIGYYRTAGTPITWPESLVANGEGCGELRLLQGYVTSDPRFRPDLYPTLELIP